MQRITSGSGARQRSYVGYVYVPRSFNPRRMRDCDSDEEESPPLDLDFDERLVSRPRVSSIVCLKLDEIERGVLELDPFENSDLKKNLKRIKQQSELTLDTHDQALRRSRRLDKLLLDSFHDKIDEIGEDLLMKHNACMQSFQRLKASSRLTLDPPSGRLVRHSSASEGTPEPIFETQRLKPVRANLGDFRCALNQQFR